VQREGKFVVKVTEAPQYRRFVAQNQDKIFTGPLLSAEHFPGCTPHQSVCGLAPASVNAGKGFAFVSHRGDVYPSGFLPIKAGNVCFDKISRIYRDAELFRKLRNPNELNGRCRRCEFRDLCGGSRSRAYAITGDYLATDPWCAYKPGFFTQESHQRTNHHPG
jgi:radical SAM protein with 4Fe4S-binding SPASM domain